MYQYFATKGNVMEAVIALQSDLLDFADYGCRVTEPKHKREVYGWIKTETRLPETIKESYGLFDG